MIDVVAILVNFNSGELCRSAVRSLLAQRFPGRNGGDGTVHVVIVDNQSPEDQHAELDPLVADNVEVIYHDRNDGYGAGMNLGLSRAPESEFVLLANPDILVLEGALDHLVRLMREDLSIGAVGPRSYLDADEIFMQPAIEMPSMGTDLFEALARAYPSFSRRLADKRTRRSIRSWLADAPQEAETLSGFALFLPGPLARELGPFDEAFPFYYEDADLCRRIRKKGLRLLFEPRSRMVHYFDRSARSVREEALKKYQQSRRRYFRKHYGGWALWLLDAVWRFASKRPVDDAAIAENELLDLGELDTALHLEIGEEERPYVLEISILPTFLFCGGHAGVGREITISGSAWDLLEPTRWYARVIDPSTGAALKSVTFQKTSPSAAPTTFEELQAGRAGS